MRTPSALLSASLAAALAQTPPNPEGQKLYTEHCAICHGAAGEGSAGPELANSAWQAFIKDEELARLIRDGARDQAMPAFRGRIPDAGVQALVAHVRALAVDPPPDTGRAAPSVQVPADRLLKADGDSANWLMYGRDYGNQRFSPLKQITAANVNRLVPAWTFQTGTPDGLQATPLAIDGMLLLSTSWNHVFAIDARTGREIWHHRRRLPQKLKYCCGPVHRGVAVRDSTVYLTTLDAHLAALDIRTGRVKWDVAVGSAEENHAITTPPLIAGKVVITGMAGGDFPARGFIDGYDAETGKRLWRFFTTAAPNEKNGGTWSGDSWKTGGAATWMNGSYDPELNLVYWGAGNPYPDYDGDVREGDNLYSDSVVALDASTGELKWFYQFTPHDVWDYDGVNEMLLLDLDWQGRKAKALVHADRNGHFFALERATGRFLYAKPFVRVSWAKGFDQNGRAIIDPSKIPTYEGVEVCPGAAGGKEWNAMSYSPLTRLVYVPVIENCAVFYNYGAKAKAAGKPPIESGFRYLPGKAYGKMIAVRPDDGSIAWEVKMRTPHGGGTLATAGGLVFTGDGEGNFIAHHAASGKILWSFQTGSGIRAAPISYEIDGTQYVAIASGMSGAVGGYTGAGAPWMKNYRTGDTLYVFALFDARRTNRFTGATTLGRPRPAR